MIFHFQTPFLREPNASLVCFYNEKEGKSTIFWGKIQNSIWQYKEKEFKAELHAKTFHSCPIKFQISTNFKKKKPLQENKIV